MRYLFFFFSFLVVDRLVSLLYPVVHSPSAQIFPPPVLLFYPFFRCAMDGDGGRGDLTVDEDTCTGDSGGPMIIRKSATSSEDVQVREGFGCVFGSTRTHEGRMGGEGECSARRAHR